MKLYYLPGSCALAPHIALEMTGTQYELIRVERGQNHEPEYLAINPLGLVPTLVDDDGSVITENIAVLLRIADAFPLAGLMPSARTCDWYQALRWMTYFATTVHPSFAMLWRPERFTVNPGCHASVRHSGRTRLKNAFDLIERHLQRRRYMIGESFTITDAYLFVFGRWGFRLEKSTKDFPELLRFTVEMTSLSAVQGAIKQQGITLGGPSDGPG